MTAPWGVAESGRFIEAGVPAAWFWRPDDFYYHSAHDTVDKLDGNALKAVADITATAVWRLANADELPQRTVSRKEAADDVSRRSTTSG